MYYERAVMGVSGNPDCPSNVNPNRRGEPISRQKRAHAIQGGEEVSALLCPQAKLVVAIVP